MATRLCVLRVKFKSGTRSIIKRLRVAWLHEVQKELRGILQFSLWIFRFLAAKFPSPSYKKLFNFKPSENQATNKWKLVFTLPPREYPRFAPGMPRVGWGGGVGKSGIFIFISLCFPGWWGECSLSLVPPIGRWMSKGFTFDLSLVTFSWHLVIWTFDFTQ